MLALTRCSQLTVKGKRCRKPALAGSDVCAVHAGRVPLPAEDVAVKLIAMLRAGNYIDVAVRAAGISRETFDAWMRRGLSKAAGARAFGELRERVERALAEGEVRGVAQIAQAAAENWQAAAWLLERQYPDRWGRPAVRQEEKPPPPVAGADGLDELAGKREARRAAVRP